MTVADLIAKLQEMPQDAVCVFPDVVFGGAVAVRRGAALMRARADGDRYRLIADDADARRHLIHVCQIALIE